MMMGAGVLGEGTVYYEGLHWGVYTMPEPLPAPGIKAWWRADFEIRHSFASHNSALRVSEAHLTFRHPSREDLIDQVRPIYNGEVEA